MRHCLDKSTPRAVSLGPLELVVEVVWPDSPSAGDAAAPCVERGQVLAPA